MICPTTTMSTYGPMVGESASMRLIFDLVDKVAPTDVTVLIVGESGTGKELIAEAIHQRSTRHGEPFVALNCGAIPESLIDTELFGHEKGAFTGATRTRSGVFERAHGGTLFLDEIAEMPVDLQVRLLRVLETNEVRRVGGDAETIVDCRVIAATNRCPKEAVDRGKLREDLLYRLSVFPITLPPLCHRQDDVILLAHHFLTELNERFGQSKQLTPEALELIKAYEWPGNVRQLKHAIQQAFILAGDRIEPRALPIQLTQKAPPPARGLDLSVGTSIAEAERRLIDATLRHYNGNKKKAAEVLGVSLRTLYNRLQTYKLEPEDYPEEQPVPADQALAV
jgi:DNA-binding NtrC family response regulator